MGARGPAGGDHGRSPTRGFAAGDRGSRHALGAAVRFVMARLMHSTEAVREILRDLKGPSLDSEPDAEKPHPTELLGASAPEISVRHVLSGRRPAGPPPWPLPRSPHVRGDSQPIPAPRPPRVSSAPPARRGMRSTFTQFAPSGPMWVGVAQRGVVSTISPPTNAASPVGVRQFSLPPPTKPLISRQIGVRRSSRKTTSTRVVK